MNGSETEGAESIDRSPTARADVCIVGAGVAGGLLAHSLAQEGFDVVVLEAGPRFDFESRLERMERALRPDISQPVWDMGGERDAYTTTGVEYDLNTHRVKGVGGSTLHWSAWTPRYHEKDFEMQTRYGLAKDWPIDYHDLQPYYASAEQHLGVAGADDNPFAPPRDEPHPLPPFPTSPIDSLYREACSTLDITLHSAPQARNSEAYDGRSQCLGYSTCNPVCPSGAKYSGDVHIQKAESEGATVIDRAPVQYLEHDDAGETIEAAVYNTPEETERRQEARTFVLAAGGIEIPRLLLLSKSETFPDGLANSSGLVGKYFMEHPVVGVGGHVEKPANQEPMFWWALESHQFYDHDEPRPGSFKLEFKQEDPFSPIQRLDDTVDVYPESVPDSWRVVVGAPVEMLPKKHNQVTLNPTETDDHGNPVPDVAFDVGPHARETMAHAMGIQTRILEAMGATNRYQTSLADPPYASHHMGTTRMGENSDESVVDPTLRTHDLRNLFVASSSVFVTAGAMNPTLTIAALALRLAEHLKTVL